MGAADRADERKARELIQQAKETSATSLELSGLEFSEELFRELAGLTALQSLVIDGCEHIVDLGPLTGLTALQALHLYGGKQIIDLGPLAGLTALQSLILFGGLSGCKQIVGLGPLAGLTALQSLTLFGGLSGGKQIVDLGPLARLTALQNLELLGCEQIVDLEPFAGLTALQNLDLYRCKQIVDLEPLAGLTALQSLKLSGCEQIVDLGPLAGLTALQSLHLTDCKQIVDLGPLAALTALQNLDLSGGKRIVDLGSLAGLTALQNLDLSYCEQIVDLGPLAGLTALQNLELSGGEQIVDLGPLAGLTALQNLELSGGEQIVDLGPLAGLTALQKLYLSDCEQIVDLRPLAGLTALQNLELSKCEQIVDLGPLAGLTVLQELDLSVCVQIIDLEPLAGLTALQKLYLSYCQQIVDLGPLAGLTALRSLRLDQCGNNLRFAPLTELLSTLEDIHLSGSHFEDLPREICDVYGENVLAAVRAHYEDLKEGQVADAEAKVLFLGNGGTGKTQLSRRIAGLEYDPSIPTTHGIQLSAVSLPMGGEALPVQLNLWDFGGQEIYHGSHSLFVQGRAVFLVLWTPKREATTPYEENGLTMRHKPLQYWVDYVQAVAGTDSRVLVIQSQCDTARQRVRHPPMTVPEGLMSVQPMQVSAKTDLGLDWVMGALKEAVRDALERRPAVAIGAGRARVRRRLLKMREDGGEQNRALERAEFERICEEEGGISDTEALLDFLHRNGVLFYRTGLFGDRIILDQNWALQGIYTLFEREKVLPLLRGYGRFTRAELEVLAWSAYTRKEQEVFLGMMEACGVCFKARRMPDDAWEYIAPELLPGCTEAQQRLLVGRLPKGDADAEVEARYGFLHDGILRGYLSKIGQHAGNVPEYWRYGCWFYEETTGSRVLIEGRWDDSVAETGPGGFRFRAWGEGAERLLEPLLTELQRLPTGQKVEITWKSSRARTTPLASVKERVLGSLVFGQSVRASAGVPQVFVSYAWGDGSSEEAKQREQVVDGLCAKINSEGWGVVRRDKTEMKPGDLISTFMKTISRGDLVIVVLSAKYLRSAYCMAELHGIYQRSLGEGAEFKQRIIPLILDDAKISDWRARLEVARYWSKEFQEMEACLAELGEEDFKLYRAMKDWSNSVGNILAYAIDVLSPQGFSGIVKDDYAALLQMIQSRRPPVDSPSAQ